MSHRTANALGAFCFLALISLGVVPLIQWFGFGHASGVIAALFGRPDGAWVWAVPAIVAIVSFACMWGFGTIAERAERAERDGRPAAEGPARPAA